jgi:16S rRNA (guanine527-N7)-methyltransferase
MLVDSIKKKINLTDMFVKHLALKDTICKCINAAELSKSPEYIDKFDFIFSRGVATIASLLEVSKPLLKKDGKYILLKGGDLAEEINTAKKQYRFEFEIIDIEIFGIQPELLSNKKIVVIRNL